jgi:Tfp pilus assembly protein PilX
MQNNRQSRIAATHALRHNRRGAVLAAALVEFVVASSILFGVLHGVVDHQRQIIVDRQQLQTQWLAQAGLDRAVAQLRAANSYRGETWQVPAEELDGAAAAKVQITLETVADHPDDLRLTVQANYPDNSIHSCQQTRTATIHLK